eukprot:jgi/Psemu1/65514/estExt_Genemark1.C_1300069
MLCIHDDTLDANTVAKEIASEHPTWKLSERRVNKFVKQYRSAQKKQDDSVDDVDDDEGEGEGDVEAPLDNNSKDVQKSSSKKHFSPSRSLRRLFSSKSKRKFTESADDPDTASDTPPSLEVASEREVTATEDVPPVEEQEQEQPVVAEEKQEEEEESEPELELELESDVVPEEEKVDEDVVYETDNDKVDSSHDCFIACSIM